MRFLKILVVVMGILLVIGFVVLGFAISKKMDSNASDQVSLTHQPTVLVPEGAKIVEIKTDNGILVMWLNFEGQDQVVFVNMKTGKIISQ